MGCTSGPKGIVNPDVRKLPEMIRALLSLLILAGCNTPGPHFQTVPATRVRVGEMVFDVRVRGDLAEAMRINTQWAPRLSGVQGPAAAAMAHVSGCRVRETSGDQALILGVLDCGDRAPGTVGHLVPVEFDCYRVDQWRTRGLNQKTAVYDCDAVP